MYSIFSLPIQKHDMISHLKNTTNLQVSIPLGPRTLPASNANGARTIITKVSDTNKNIVEKTSYALEGRI